MGVSFPTVAGVGTGLPVLLSIGSAVSRVLLYPNIQFRLPDAVGGTELLAMVHIVFAEILHSAVSVPGSNPRDKGTAAVTAGKQSGIAVPDFITLGMDAAYLAADLSNIIEEDNYIEDCTTKHFRPERKKQRSYHYFCHDIHSFSTAIFNLERLELGELKHRNQANFAKVCLRFFSNEEYMKALYLLQPFHGVAGFSLSPMTKMEIVVVPNPKMPEEMIFARKYGFLRLMDFLVTDFFEGLQAGHAPRQCEICGRYFLTTDGRQQRYCNGYAPGDSRKRSCQAVAARMGRKEREKAATHPVKIICERRCNTIDHHLRSGKLDKEFAITAKRIAREKRDRAIRDNDYFTKQYEEEMTQETIYAEAE